MRRIRGGSAPPVQPPVRPRQRVALPSPRVARVIGLTPVAVTGLHAEMTVIQGASTLRLTPTAGVSTNIVCPECAIYIQRTLTGELTGPLTFQFGFER